MLQNKKGNAFLVWEESRQKYFDPENGIMKLI